MADRDFNLIKPVENLTSIVGLTSAQRRKERKPQQQHKENKEEDGQELDQQTDEEILEAGLEPSGSPVGEEVIVTADENASGDTRRIVTTIRAPVDHAAAAANRSGSTKAYTAPRAQIPAMDVAIAFPA